MCRRCEANDGFHFFNCLFDIHISCFCSFSCSSLKHLSLRTTRNIGLVRSCQAQIFVRRKYKVDAVARYETVEIIEQHTAKYIQQKTRDIAEIINSEQKATTTENASANENESRIILYSTEQNITQTHTHARTHSCYIAIKYYR